MPINQTFQDFVNLMFDTEETVWSSTTVINSDSIKLAKDIPEGDNYFSPNPVKGTRSNDNVVSYHTLFAENDDLSIKEQRDLITPHKDKISAIVFSGNKSYHVFIRLETPLSTKDEWLKYQKKLTLLLNGDPSRSGSSSAMRLPFALRVDTNRQQTLVHFGTRQPTSAIMEYLDQHIPDNQVNLATPKAFKEYDLNLTVEQKTKLEILASNPLIRKIIEEGEPKEEGDAKGWKLACHLFKEGHLTKEEVIYMLLKTRKGKENSNWAYRTVENAIIKLAAEEPVQDEPDENESTPQRIKRHLQQKKNSEDTKDEIIDSLSKKDRTLKRKAILNAISRLFEREEIFTRSRNGVELISILPPALVDTDIHVDYVRYMEKANARVAAYPHPEWNRLSGGGLVRGCLTGLVSPTSTGKTHFVSAMAAEALKHNLRVLIISTEREPGYYVDYITCALTGTAHPTIDQKRWAAGTIDMVESKQLLLPKQSAGITVDEILEYIQCHNGVDLLLFDYLHPQTIRVGMEDSTNTAAVVAAIRLIEAKLTSDKLYKELGVSKMPAVLCVLQRKEGWTRETAQFWPKGEITGEKQGAYAQPFETIFTLVDDECTGPTTDRKYTNKYVVSKSKPSCGELLEGVEFSTVVRAKTNTTEDFAIGWNACSKIALAVAAAINTQKRSEKIEEEESVFESIEDQVKF